MTDIIKFCNTNVGFLSAVTSLLSIVLAAIAIFISINVSKRQCRISLLDQRIKVIESIDVFCKSLYKDSFDLSKHKRISKAQITSLFDKDSYLIYEKIYSYGETIKQLQGNKQFAKKHETCNNFTVEEIEKMIFETAEECSYEYNKFKDKFFVKFAKI